MTLPERLTQMRKGAGLSQQDLVERIYVTRQAVSQWENGARVPNTDNLMHLSKLYGVSVDYLLHGEAAQEPQAPVEAAPETVAVEDAPEAVKAEAVKQPTRFRVQW